MQDDATISELWRPSAVILVVEHRRCQCCDRVTITPNLVPHIELTLESPQRPHRTRLRALRDSDTIAHGLPKRLQHIDASVRICHECFRESNPAQLTIFDAIEHNAILDDLDALLA